MNRYSIKCQIRNKTLQTQRGGGDGRNPIILMNIAGCSIEF